MFAVAMAVDVGRRALTVCGAESSDSYAKPDSDIAIDMRMKIAPHEPGEIQASRQEKYISDGFNLFLSENIHARFFASTLTRENICLVMRTMAKFITSEVDAKERKKKKTPSGALGTSDSISVQVWRARRLRLIKRLFRWSASHAWWQASGCLLLTRIGQREGHPNCLLLWSESCNKLWRLRTTPKRTS